MGTNNGYWKKTIILRKELFQAKFDFSANEKLLEYRKDVFDI